MLEKFRKALRNWATKVYIDITGSPLKQGENLAPEGAAARLGRYTDPAEACSACYAALIHALKRAEEDGSIENLRGRKIAAGQGYRGKAPEIGIGACCRNAAINVPGCPAKADEIAGMIRSL